MIENIGLTPITLVKRLTGLSTDKKPTEGLGTGSTFLEVDTGTTYTYSVLNINPETNDGWWKSITQVSGGSNGGGIDMVDINTIQESATRVFVTPEQRTKLATNTMGIRVEGSVVGENSFVAGKDNIAGTMNTVAEGFNTVALNGNLIDITSMNFNTKSIVLNGSLPLEFETGSALYLLPALGGTPKLVNAVAINTDRQGFTYSQDISDWDGLYSRALIPMSANQDPNQTAHAEGMHTAALAPGAHAEGSGTTAFGKGAHSEGMYTKAVTQASHAGGYNAVALEGTSGVIDHVEQISATQRKLVQKGNQPTINASPGEIVYIAFRDGSFGAFPVVDVVEGDIIIEMSNRTSFGQPAYIARKREERYMPPFAHGNNTVAFAEGATAIGTGLAAVWQGQTVLGQYNEVTPFDAFQVGYGESDYSRKNILSMNWNGDMKISGNSITLGDGTVLGASGGDDASMPAAVVMEASTETPGVDGVIRFKYSNKVTIIYVESQADEYDYENQTQTVFLLLGWDNLVKLSGPDPEGYTLERHQYYASTGEQSYKVVWTSGYHSFYVGKLL